MRQRQTGARIWLGLTSRLARSRRGDGDDERGATVVEYGMLVALVVVVLVAIIATLETETQQAFQDVEGGVSNAVWPGPN